VSLIESASEYLVADGYAVTKRGRSLVVGNRATLGENTEFVYVWVVDDAALRSFGSQEEPFMRMFTEVAVTFPRSNRFLLVPTTQGLSREFTKRALEQDVRVRVPVQFFRTSPPLGLTSTVDSRCRPLQRAPDAGSGFGVAA
jgi:hypothetical protein